MNKRRIFLIGFSSLVALLALAAFILDKSGYVVRALKPQVVEALSTATGRPVAVDSVEGGIFGSIALKGLSLGRAPHSQRLDVSLRVEKAVVTFSLWDFLIRHRKAAESLQRLEFQDPLITLHIQPAQAPNLSQNPNAAPMLDLGTLLSTLPLPPVQTLVEGGRMELSVSSQGQGLLLLDNIQASLGLRDSGDSAHLEFNAQAYGGHLRASGDFSPSGQSGNATLNLSGLELNLLQGAPGLPAGLPSFKEGRLTGNLELKLVQGTDAQWVRGLSVQGGLQLQGASLALAGRQLEDASADLQLNERQCRLDSLHFKYSGGQWQGSGRVADLRDPEVQADLKGQGPGLTLAGLKVDQASLSMTAGSQGLAVEQLTLANGEGRLEASGSMNPVSGTSNLNFTGAVVRFPMAVAHGELSGSFRVGGTLQQISAEAHLGSRALHVGAEDFSNVQMGVSLNGKHLSLAGNFDWRTFSALTLSAEGQLDSGHLALTTASLKQAGTSLVHGSFSTDFSKDGNIKAKSSLGPIEAASLVKAYALPLHVTGPLSASLELSGKTTAPSLAINLSGALASSGPVKEPLPLQAELLLKGGQLSIKRFELAAKQVTASGFWSAAQDSKIQIALKKAGLPLLLAIGSEPLPEPMAGTLDGSLVLSHAEHGLQLDAQLKAKAVQLGSWVAESAAIRGSLSSRQWSFDDFHALQAGGGVLEGEGFFDPQGSGNAELKLTAKNWIYSGRPGSGELEISGSRPGRLKSWFHRAADSGNAQREIGGDLSLENFALAGTALPDLKGNWSWYERGELAVSELSWGAGYSADLNAKTDGSWSARADLRDADPKPLAALLKLNGPALRQALNLHADAQGQPQGGTFNAKLGSQATATLSWAKNSDGSAHWLGTANAKSLELSRLLELAAFAGLDSLKGPSRSFGGHLNADLALDSAMALPLSFSASIDNLTQGGDSWGSLALSGSASSTDLHVDLLDLGVSQSRFQMHAADLKKTGEGSYRFDAAFDSNDFPEGAYFRFGGHGNLHLKTEADDSKAELHWKSLAVNQTVFGSGAAGLLWKDRLLSIDDLQVPPRYHAALKVPKKGDPMLEALTATLDKNGSLEAHHSLDEDGKQRLEISGHGVDLGMLAGALDWDLKLGGSVYGNAVLRSAETPEGHMKLLVSAKIENGNLEGFPFDLATGSVKLEQGLLDLNPLGEPVRVVRRNRYEAEVQGTVPLDTDSPAGAAPDQINMDAKLLSGNMGMFDFLDVVDSGTGTVTAQVKIKGTAKYPEYSGKMEVSGGTLKFKRLLGPATDIQGSLFVDQNKLELLRLDAQMGDPGQRVYLEHGPGNDTAMTFDQWIISTFNLRISSGKAGIHFQSNDRYDFIGGTVFPDLLLSGSWDEPHFQGKVSLANATITYPIIDKDAGPEDPKGFTNRMLWDVGVKAGDNVIFTNSIARVELLSDEKGVRLYGPGRDITLEGKVRPLRGRLTFYSSDFKIDDTHDNHIDFLGEQPPSLNLWANKSVRSAQGYDTPIELQVSGNLGNVQMHLSSTNTDLTDAQLASMAGLGVDITGSSDGGAALGAGITLAGKFVVNKLFGLFSSKFKGIKNVDVNVSAPGIGSLLGGGGSSTLSSTAEGGSNTLTARDIGQVQVGSYLPGSKLYGTAAVDWKESANGSTAPGFNAGVEYQVGRGQKVQALAGSDESKLEYQAQSSMDNYNPRKRKEQLEAARLAKLATPTPSPIPTPDPSPSPSE